MAEEDKSQGEAPGKPQEGHSAVRFTETHEEAKAKLDEAKASEGQPTAEQLKVDQASFDKFFNKESGQFNWEAYAREQQFKAEQKNKPKEGEEQPKEGKEPPKHSSTPSDDEAKDLADKAGLDWGKLEDSVRNTGDITAEDREALKNIGIPDNVINSYLDNVKAGAQAVIDSVIEASGGQDTFNKVFDALQDKPMETRQKIDTLLNDPDTREYGLDMMFREAGIPRPNVASTPAPPPPPPNPGQPNNAPKSGDPAGFTSFEEQVAAQRDPRYRTDSAYRAQVERRIQLSTYELNPRTHTGGL